MPTAGSCNASTAAIRLVDGDMCRRARRAGRPRCRGGIMNSRKAGVMLAAAAALFWAAWVLMPGVGVTDAAQIFQLVSARRSLVAISVVVQLVSAVLYVPALLALHSAASKRNCRRGLGRRPAARRRDGLRRRRGAAPARLCDDDAGSRAGDADAGDGVHAGARARAARAARPELLRRRRRAVGGVRESRHRIEVESPAPPRRPRGRRRRRRAGIGGHRAGAIRRIERARALQRAAMPDWRRALAGRARARAPAIRSAPRAEPPA